MEPFEPFEDIVTYLLNGRHINSVDSGGLAIIHHASLSSDSDLTKCILSMGGDLNCLCSQGRTALHYSAIQNDFHTFNTLMTFSINFNSLDIYGKKAHEYTTDSEIIKLVEFYSFEIVF